MSNGIQKPITIKDYSKLFLEQISVNVGGFYNPEIVYEDDAEVCFRCHYDNYSDDSDSWNWYYDKQSGKFYR